MAEELLPALSDSVAFGPVTERLQGLLSLLFHNEKASVAKCQGMKGFCHYEVQISHL